MFSPLIMRVMDHEARQPPPVRRALRWDDVDVGTRRELVRGAPLPPEIQRIHDTYYPRVMPLEEWNEVADTARAWFVLAAPQERQLALQLILLFARFARWATELRLPLDAKVLFTPVMVDRYSDWVITSPLGPSGAEEYRALLRRVGPVVGDSKNWVKPGKQIGRTAIAAPLRADVEHSCINQARRADEHHLAMCLLGFGCGLDGRWLPHVRGIDVVEIDGWPHVQVADPDARAIPVLERYAAELVHLATCVGGGFLIGGEQHVQNRVWVLTRKILITEGRKLFVGEMRSTWFAKHLVNKTHLVYLSHITGVKSFARLLEVLAHVEVPDMGDMARQARSA